MHQAEARLTAGNVWWRLMRPHTLTASFVPVIIGTAMALYYDSISIALFLAMLLASILIQAATNMFNEYYDYKRGLDTAHSVGIGGTIVRDGVKPSIVLNLALIFYLVALLLGIYICYESSWWIAVAGLVSMAVGYLYSGGPYPIANTPLGELFSGIFMGPVIILITFYIQTGTVTKESLYISFSIALFIGAINLANNIRDLEGDKASGRKTLAILLGRPLAILFLSGLFLLAFSWIIILVAINAVTAWVLLALLSIPKALQAARLFKGKSRPIEMMPAMKASAQVNTYFGFLLTIGLLIAYGLANLI